MEKVKIRVRRDVDGLVYLHSCGEYVSVVEGSTATINCARCRESWSIRNWQTVHHGLLHAMRIGTSGYRVTQRGLEVHFSRFTEKSDSEEVADATTEPEELVRQ